MDMSIADSALHELSLIRRTDMHRSMPGASVSVIVPVKNEAENLRRCLPALMWADEVFVIDSQSSDETAKVAAEFGATVIQFHFNGSYPKKKNWALETVPFRNDWVLIIDADEVVVPELASEITRRIPLDEAEGYYLNSKYFFLGRRIRYCGYSECWNLRLFQHRLGRYERMADRTGGRTGDNEAHEHVELEGRVLHLSHELEHHAYPTIATWVEKHNRYAVWEAAMYRAVPERAGTRNHWPGQTDQALAQEALPPAAHAPPGSLLLMLTSSAWVSSTADLAWSSAPCWLFTTSWHGPMSMNSESLEPARFPSPNRLDAVKRPPWVRAALGFSIGKREERSDHEPEVLLDELAGGTYVPPRGIALN